MDGDFHRRVQMEVDAGINLEYLAYCPNVNQSKRPTRELQRYGSEVACVTADFEEPSDILSTYSKASSGSDGARWMEAMRFEIDSLTEMETWEFLHLSVGRLVVKTR